MAITPIIQKKEVLPERQTDSMRGIALMAFGMFLFSAVDTMGKFLTETVHPIQIVWFRQLGLFLGVVVLISIQGTGVLSSKNPKLQIGRGALAACSATLFIVGVSYVPLADAVAITFVAPFIVTVMGALILREQVGIRRWSAVVIGFLGTLIVIRPGMGVIHPASILLIVAASAFAMRQVLSRILAGEDRTRTTVAYTAIVSWGLLTLPLPFVWQTPSSGLDLVLLLGMAVLAAAAEVLVIMALDAAQAVVVAPVQYSLLIWGTIYGFFVFGQLPDSWTWLGAAIIVATGLYTLNRERLALRTRK
ncbi:DMT family transporter [Ruegeria arenilitoris]|uniref:DMT family transporter n=1 Tax=Ruegeria arenilitoris TaxID=1173585 RepID=UPI0020C42791|nr:DMT family transporter [Ruegeria arenilitoris]